MLRLDVSQSILHLFSVTAFEIDWPACENISVRLFLQAQNRGAF